VAIALGFVTSVSTAWLTCALARSGSQQITTILHASGATEVQTVERSFGRVRIEREYHWRFGSALPSALDLKPRIDVRAGWPLKSMAWYGFQPAVKINALTCIEVPSTCNQLRGSWRIGKDVILPCNVIWSGSVSNAVLYAAVLLVGYTCFGYYRFKKRRLGNLCSRCGYPRGASARCSECGALEGSTVDTSGVAQ